LSAEFTWRDAGRTVVFRRGGIAGAPALLREHGFDDFTLLSTLRALAGNEGLTGGAGQIHEVSRGQVPDAAAAVIGALASPPQAEEGVRVRPLVALGGGRVIDVAKAVAAVCGAEVAAIPTTLSGAPMTAIHRLPKGAEERVRGMVRPRLVVADPEAMTSQPEAALRASAMNALGHGADTLYLPHSNPVSEMTALRGAELIGRSLDQEREGRDRPALALGSLLGAYAIDSAGIGLHHVICQTLVRVCGTPHAETNAAVLPHSLAFLAGRAPGAYERLATALETDLGDLRQRVEQLGQPQSLSDVGGNPSKLDEAIEAMLKRSELGHVPNPPSREELAGLVRNAW
jgi:alcohol dehydrogenase class IV